MDDLTQLSDLVKRRNSVACDITALIGRPAQLGHIGEYVASTIFPIVLEQCAAHKGSDGRFSDAPLKGRTVNIKWYSMREGLLDINPDALPDYYLVLTGPQSAAISSRGRVRPWIIEAVFLFDTHNLVPQLEALGVRIGIASSVRQQFWEQAEIYPNQSSAKLMVSEKQRKQLRLFNANSLGG